ncbi:hypothetical protein ACPCVO_50110 [Streptomyces umbrinus]
MVSWQDQRGGERAALLQQAGTSEEIRRRTGLYTLTVAEAFNAG